MASPSSTLVPLTRDSSFSSQTDFEAIPLGLKKQKVLRLFSNLKPEERQPLMEKALKIEDSTLEIFLKKLKRGPEAFVERVYQQNIYCYPNEAVFCSLRAFIEDKISESMVVTIVLLWSHVNYFGQAPKTLKGTDLQKLVETHGLETAMNNQTVSDLEKKIYSFDISQPTQEDSLEYYDTSDDEDSPRPLPWSFQKIHNSLESSRKELIGPLHSISKKANGVWYLIMPSFYLTQNDSTCRNIRLLPKVGLTPNKKMYRYFFRNKHPYTLPFPDTNNANSHITSLKNCGKDYAPGCSQQDAYLAFLKSHAVNLGAYNLVEHYLANDLAALKQQVMDIPEYDGKLKKNIQRILQQFERSFYNLDIISTVEEGLADQATGGSDPNATKERLFINLLIQILAIKSLKSLVDLFGDSEKKNKSQERNIAVFEKLEHLFFDSLVKSFFPKRIDTRNIEKIYLDNDDTSPNSVDIKFELRKLIERYNQQANTASKK